MLISPSTFTWLSFYLFIYLFVLFIYHISSSLNIIVQFCAMIFLCSKFPWVIFGYRARYTCACAILWPLYRTLLYTHRQQMAVGQTGLISLHWSHMHGLEQRVGVVKKPAADWFIISELVPIEWTGYEWRSLFCRSIVFEVDVRLTDLLLPCYIYII